MKNLTITLPNSYYPAVADSYICKIAASLQVHEDVAKFSIQLPEDLTPLQDIPLTTNAVDLVCLNTIVARKLIPFFCDDEKYWLPTCWLKPFLLSFNQHEATWNWALEEANERNNETTWLWIEDNGGLSQLA